MASNIYILAVWLSFLAKGADAPHARHAPSTNDPYCAISPEALKYMAPSTIKMAELLQRIASLSDPEQDTFSNRRRVELFKRKWLATSNATEALEFHAQFAQDLLNAGETERAIQEFDAVEKEYLSRPSKLRSRFRSDVKLQMGVAYMRLGEQENCILMHGSDSCIFPIQGNGIHKAQRGSRAAIDVFQDYLKGNPRSQEAAWLLNIAYMTVGEYPEKVPAQWLVPARVFASDYDIKHFQDIAPGLGLDVNDNAGGTIAEDFDGDGFIDLMTSDVTFTGQMHYFRNNGDGSFTDRTMQAGLSGLVAGLNLIQGDYNNDGLPDVLVLRGGWRFNAGNLPDSLLRNDGNGHFTDVTAEAGLINYAPNQTATWLDFNGDGKLDIYFAYESSKSESHPCQLFRNNGDGTFTECAAAAGIAAVGFVKAVVSGDFNNDGRPDLYLSRLGQPNILFRNDGPKDVKDAKGGDWKFTDVSAQAGVTEPLKSFPAWFFDYDNDGWEDIFVCGYKTGNVGDVLADYLGQETSADRAKLYHNNHDGTFTDVSKQMHLNHVILAMGANFGDFDNDGWLDVYLGTGDPDLRTLVPNRAFRNAEGKVFQDVTTSGGFGHLQKGHGISFADFDNDGDQDIYHSVGGAYEGDFYRNVLFENPGHGNHWIKLKFEGEQSNRVAIGARIKVVIEENGKEREIHRTVCSGGSFGASPLMQEIGLGKAHAIKYVEIFWPVTGKTQRIENLALDARYRIHEGTNAAELWPLKPFKFAHARD
jgi:hypothetical protein